MSDVSSLDVKQLVVQYGDHRVLSDIAFSLTGGQYTLLIGENGAGKSTLLRCMAGWQRPGGGAVYIEGVALEHQERQARRWIKLVPDSPQFYTELTMWEHVAWVAQAHKMTHWESQAEELIKTFGIGSNRAAYPGSFSRGMQYKLALVMALICQPAILLLDEPFGPLDPYSQEYLAHILRQRVNNGMLVLASSHLLPETDPPDRVMVLDEGALAADLSWDEIMTRYPNASPVLLPSRILRDVVSVRRSVE